MFKNGFKMSSLKIFYVIISIQSDGTIQILQTCCYFSLNLNYWKKLNMLFFAQNEKYWCILPKEILHLRIEPA